MKKYFLLFCLGLSLNGWTQAPDLMTYQAVIWDTGNNLVTNSPVGLQLSILQGSVAGPSVYTETHTPTSNTNGLVTVEIGNGTVVSGDISTIDWSNGPYFLQTETDPNGGTTYTITGTTQLLSVPYALYANVADSVVNDMVDDADADPTNEFNTSAALVGTDLNLTDGGGTLTVDLSSLSGGGGTDDQTLSLVGTDLSIEDGNTVTLNVNDADSDPSNELQTISMVGNVLTLSLGGGSVIVPASLDDDPTNEFQDLSFSNDTVYISDGTETYIGPEAPISPTLNAPAVNIGIPYSDAAYYKEGDRVYLQGVLNSCALNQTLFTLPLGYRPTRRVILTTNADNVIGRVDVYPNGDVRYLVGPAVASVSLDGLSFRITN